MDWNLETSTENGIEEDVIDTESATVDKFADFLRGFTLNNVGIVYPYTNIINALHVENKTIIIDSDHFEFDLYSYFFNNKKVEYHLRLLNKAVQNVYEFLHPELTEDFPLSELSARISVKDKALVTKMKKLNISHRGKLTVMDAIIISKSEVKNTIREKKFKCNNCNQVFPEKLPRCIQSDCGLKTIVMSVGDSVWTDCEYIELQERQEDLLSTSTIPTKINAKVYGDLVGVFKAGDSVRVTGVIKMQKTVSDAVINKADDDEFSSDVIFDRVLEVHNLELLSSSENTVINDPSKYLTEADINNIQKIRKMYPDDDDLTRVLINSTAPHVYGYSEVKESILLQNVGSIVIEKDGQKTRDKLNILLVGDPGVNKTRLLNVAMKLSPNGHMASGKGASGVGLTASVGNEGGIHKLKVGAVVLAHNGHISIDEFSEISDDDKGYLLDCLEDGIFRVNKAGINTLVNADASVLVATNPDSGRYNIHNSLFENLTMSSQLFSRFHLVFVMLDKINRENDKNIALHIMSTYDEAVVSKYRPTVTTNKTENENETANQKISHDLLFKYLLYAKTNNRENIQLTKEAMDIILDFYHQIRTPREASDITATARQLDGMLKLAYARCRLMLRNVVTEKIAQRTVELIRFGFMSAGMIMEETGGLNLTAEYSKPLDKVNKKLAFTMVVNNLTKEGTQPVFRNDIVDELRVKARWMKDEADQIFDRFYDEGKMLKNANGQYILTD